MRHSIRANLASKMQLARFAALPCLLALGCSQPRRIANVAFVAGVQVTPVTVKREGFSEGQTMGGVHLGMQAAETDDWVSGRGRIDAAIGGNSNGVAGQAALDADLGFAAFDGEHHIFGRAGLAGALERDPLTGLYALEVPTATLGYQYHGTGTSSWTDSMHFDLGPRAALGAVGRAFAGTRHVDFVAAPEVGGRMLLMGEFLTFEVTYMHVFEGEPLDTVRGSTCFAAFFAACLDTRHVIARFDGTQQTVAASYGVTFGFGLATGVEPGF